MFSPNWVTLDHRKKVAWAKIDRDLFGFRLLRHHRHHGRMRSDHPILRLLLPVHHQSPQGQKTAAASIRANYAFERITETLGQGPIL